MKNLSRSILISLVISILSLLSISANGQYYIRLQDASGFDTDPYQTALNEAAHQLVQAFPDTFQSRFRVFSCGFYAEQEFYGNDFGYPQAFGRFREQAAESSDFYLLFGRESDSKGVYTKFWVDLKLPETGKFQCTDEFKKIVLSEKLKGIVKEKYQPASPTQYASAESETISYLSLYIQEAINCCDVSNKMPGGSCDLCLTPEETKIVLLNKGFIGLKCKIADNTHTGNGGNPKIMNYAHSTVDGIDLISKLSYILNGLPSTTAKIYITDNAAIPLS